MARKEDPKEGCHNCKWFRPGTNSNPNSLEVGTCHGYGATPALFATQEKVPTLSGVQVGMVIRQHDLWPQVERFRFCPKWEQGEPTPNPEDKPQAKTGSIIVPVRGGGD